MRRFLLWIIKAEADRVILRAEYIDLMAVLMELLNEQWFIDWQDRLNKISVR